MHEDACQKPCALTRAECANGLQVPCNLCRVIAVLRLILTEERVLVRHGTKSQPQRGFQAQVRGDTPSSERSRRSKRNPTNFGNFVAPRDELSHQHTALDTSLILLGRQDGVGNAQEGRVNASRTLRTATSPGTGLASGSARASTLRLCCRVVPEVEDHTTCRSVCSSCAVRCPQRVDRHTKTCECPAELPEQVAQLR